VKAELVRLALAFLGIDLSHWLKPKVEAAWDRNAA